LRDVHYASSGLLRHRASAIAGAVVGNQHFTCDLCAREEAARLGDAVAHSCCLVEAGHENRELGHPASQRPQKKRYPEGYLSSTLCLVISRGRSRADTSAGPWCRCPRTSIPTASRCCRRRSSPPPWKSTTESA